MPVEHDNSALQGYVGMNARRLRERLGLPQDKLAASVGMSPSRYRAVEGGRVNLTLATLVRIADRLGVPADLLLRPTRIVRRGPGRPKKRS